MSVPFEWDERKRQSNIEKHGVDFADLKALFEGPISDRLDDRKDYGELRYIAVGDLRGNLVTVVYTWRRGSRRIISARKANKDECEDYYLQTVQER